MNRIAVSSSLLSSIGFEPNPEKPGFGTVKSSSRPAKRNRPACTSTPTCRKASIREFLAAESQGEFFLHQFKGLYAFTKVEQQESEPTQTAVTQEK